MVVHKSNGITQFKVEKIKKMLLDCFYKKVFYIHRLRSYYSKKRRKQLSQPIHNYCMQIQ